MHRRITGLPLFWRLFPRHALAVALPAFTPATVSIPVHVTVGA